MWQIDGSALMESWSDWMDAANSKTLSKLGFADKLFLIHLYDVKLHIYLIFRRLMNIFEITNIRMTTY